MVDTSSFKVSRNLAVTPGAVVLRTEVLELIQYRPQTAQVREVPLLIVPPTGSLQKLHPASQRSARRQPSAPLSLEHREIAAAGVLREAPPQIAATGNLGARQRTG
jgi:Poly-beta-hydroxybutyrate polymerase (PhaC) N-terminus